jgi:glycogen synthase
MENPWRDIDESAEWLLQLERTIKPDLVHLNCYAYGTLPFRAPKIIVAHSDVYSWYFSVKREDPPAKWNEYYWRVKKGLRSADLLIAPSQTMMQHMQHIYSVNIPGQVIYNARSFEYFSPSEKQPYVMAMGRIWDEAKNIGLLTEAAQYIKHPIKIAGDNSFAGNVFTASYQNVSYLGKLSTPEVAKQLSHAAVYALPAKYEPFGLSILEAALSGCALVLGNINSLKEIWKDNALYVDTDDTRGLAQAVNSLMSNKEELKQYAGKAYIRALEFSTEVLAEKYLHTYQQVVQQQSRKVKEIV